MSTGASLGNTVRYRVYLRPYTYYFFNPNTGKGLGDSQEYYKRSLALPQQTAVLGLVRYQLLVQNNIISRGNGKIDPRSYTKADKLIGKKSFNGRNADFGAVRKISPVFMARRKQSGEEVKSCQLNRAYCKPDDESEYKLVSHAGTQSSLFLSPEDPRPHIGNSLDGFDAKMGWQEVWIDGDGKPVMPKDIFFDHAQSGIAKSYRGGTNESSYFKMIYKGLKPGWFFTFDIELDMHQADGDTVEFDSATTFFGSEGMRFKMDVKLLKEESALIGSDTGKALLLSDLFVPAEQEDDFMDCIDFGVTSTRHFNNFRTENSSSHNRRQKPEFRDGIKVIRMGSLLFVNPGKKEKLKDVIESMATHRMVGYNHIQYIG